MDYEDEEDDVDDDEVEDEEEVIMTSNDGKRRSILSATSGIGGNAGGGGNSISGGSQKQRHFQPYATQVAKKQSSVRHHAPQQSSHNKPSNLVRTPSNKFKFPTSQIIRPSAVYKYQSKQQSGGNNGHMPPAPLIQPLLSTSATSIPMLGLASAEYPNDRPYLSQMNSAASVEYVKDVIFSTFTLFFCNYFCMGFLSLYYSIRSLRAHDSMQPEMARQYGRKAKRLNNILILTGFVVFVIVFIMFITSYSNIQYFVARVVAAGAPPAMNSN